MFFNKLITVIFILNIAMVGGCIVGPYQYEYIHISDAVKEKGKAYQTAEINRLVNHKPMPIFHLIDRGNYTIHFELDRMSFNPAVFITAKKASGGLLYLKVGNQYLGCGRFDKFYEDEFYEIEKQLKYVWSNIPSCPGKLSDQIIIFQILNDQGVLLGEEKIPFTIKENGFFYGIDAL